MKKATINLSYDEEKLNALKLYLKQKDINLDAELTKSLDTLFNKTVPASVREFIGMRSGLNQNDVQKHRTKPPSSGVGKSEKEIKTNG